MTVDGMITMQDHDEHSRDQQGQNQLSHPLNGVLLLGEPEIFCLHRHAKAFNLCQDRGQRDLFLLEPRSIDPDPTHHGRALEADERQGHVRPAFRRRRLASAARELGIVDIHGKASIKVLFADGGLWAVSLACSDVEETQLVPDEPSNVDLDGRQSIRFAITLQAYALGNADRRGRQGRMGSEDLIAAERDLRPKINLVDMIIWAPELIAITNQIHYKSLQRLHLRALQELGPG